MALAVTVRPVPVSAQTPDPSSIPEDASESYVVREIMRMRESTEIDPRLKPLYILDYVDTLLERFPNSSFRDEALILKLTSLSGLARTEPRYLQELLSLTERVAKENPQGRLASENAFYAIQAFVLGARVEDMPEERRLLGVRERYEAFLEDHPNSLRAPTIAASLTRNLLALNEIDKAEKWVKKLREQHPDHSATRRAEGELLRARAVGKPFRFEHTTADGKTLRTADYLGKVVVVHFWRSRSDDAIKAIPKLLRLHEEFKDSGLQLIGVNIDADCRRADRVLQKHKMPWPQFFEEKGFRGEILVKNGVVRIPTYFVIDRDGVLRSTDPGDKLPDLIKELLAKPATAASSEE